MKRHYASNMAALLIITALVLAIVVPIAAILLFKVLYRRELALFTVGGLGYPILGPSVATVGFATSAILSYLKLRRAEEDSDAVVLRLLFSLTGAFVCSCLIAWRVFGEA